MNEYSFELLAIIITLVGITVSMIQAKGKNALTADIAETVYGKRSLGASGPRVHTFVGTVIILVLLTAYIFIMVKFFL